MQVAIARPRSIRSFVIAPAVLAALALVLLGGLYLNSTRSTAAPAGTPVHKSNATVTNPQPETSGEPLKRGFRAA
ncbi:MAG: hypothetical protein E6J02_10225 [Chloroflexi bacterium]|nr:MAG: hypothetical protein E6J02_10225 [Chloroflexota bacterium]